VDGEHTHKVNFLGQFDLPESKRSFHKSSIQRREEKIEWGRENDFGGRDSSSREYIVERGRKTIMEFMHGLCRSF